MPDLTLTRYLRTNGTIISRQLDGWAIVWHPETAVVRSSAQFMQIVLS